ncbi:asparagine synthase (glutamine-hydrolyzing) [Syntrophotalea acetylenivorans]|uniref:asparagine synthase (glutamine-hydrolyzing) n=1 Tax=Syntrophotalea acetylenivorans TaxID=1842532 RepID=A0A1L3GSS0_9BACT|nr:asparagine synthase (glutamine-hydrolyzing) [Syntrophotalea acetylenivorans]
MCGIIGPPAAGDEWQETVGAMMKSLAHRGPDDAGLTSGKGFAFGHRRLSIIDLEHGKQPMQTVDGRYTLVFNGEIYNYLELRNQLIQQGSRFRTFSDTEVLLQLLIRDGEQALELLNGMFAFAFHDSETGKWLLARDPFGIKPLYYSKKGDSLYFSSEIKSLFSASDIRPRQNWKALQHYLTFQVSLSEETLFDGVKKVEPGCYIVGNRSGMQKIVRYWDTNYQIDNHHTEEYFKDRLLTLLEDSARLQIRSDVPLGAYLSGGLDSSSVASMAADHLGSSIKVFTGRFAEGPAYDESAYARQVAEKIGAEYLEVVPTAEQFVDCLPKLIYAMDEPVAGPGLFPQYIVSSLASEHVKVVLGGQGGDEIFGGYARYLIGYLEQALKGAIFETQEEAQHIVTLSSIIPNLPLLKEYRPLMQRFWHDGLFDDMDARYFRLIDRSPDVETLLTADARRAYNREEVFADFQQVFNHPDTKSYVNKMTHFDLKTLLPALLQVEDRVSMAVSLESRVPLLDTRIVDLITTMPPQMKFQGGKTKYIFKQAVKNLIPAYVMNRKDKMGFPVPLKEWMENGIVRDFIHETLLGKPSRDRGLFDPKALEDLIVKEKTFGRQIWGALCLELWHQRFIDGGMA